MSKYDKVSARIDSRSFTGYSPESAALIHLLQGGIFL